MVYFTVNLVRKSGGALVCVLPASDTDNAKNEALKRFGSDVKIVDVVPYRGVVVRDVRAEEQGSINAIKAFYRERHQGEQS